jgi:hypothetical protein
MNLVEPDVRHLAESGADTLVLFTFEQDFPFRGFVGELDWYLRGELSQAYRKGFSGGMSGETLLVPCRNPWGLERVLILGLGPRERFSDSLFRTALVQGVSQAMGLHAKTLALDLSSSSTTGSLPHGQLMARCAWEVFEELQPSQRLTLMVPGSEHGTFRDVFQRASGTPRPPHSALRSPD